MQMQKDGYALIPLFREPPPMRPGALIEEEVGGRGVGRGVGGEVVGVEPAGGVEPEDGGVAVGAEAGHDALGGVFEGAGEGAHDEDGDGGVDGVGELADRFDEGEVGVFEEGGQVPGGFVVAVRVGFEGGLVGAAEVEDLGGGVRGGGRGGRVGGRAYDDVGDVGVEEPGVFEVG